MEKKYDVNGTMGHPRRATGGVLEFITTGNSYVQNQGGVLTAPDFNTFLREGFTYPNDHKILFSGGVILQALSEISRGQLQTKVGDTTYGVKISDWMTTFGTISVVHDPMFIGNYGGYGFLLDLECFKYRYMNNRDTKFFTNVQNNDTDGEVDQYVTECGLQRTQAARCALIKGVE